MARKPSLFPQTMIYIAITVALIASVVGYILRYQEPNDSDPVYALDLSPSSPALQQKVTDTLTQKINENAQTNDDDDLDKNYPRLFSPMGQRYQEV